MNPLAYAALVAWWAATSGPYYAHGLQLAQQKRWSEARQAFEAGSRLYPKDARFATGLAGVAYRQSDRGAAKRYLRKALSLDPGNAYSREFLGTIYLLDGNTEAALQEWNRIGRPRIEEIRYDPQPRLDPALADRAVAFAPAAVLRVEDYRETIRRLELTGLFARPRIALESREDEGFDAVIRAPERRPHWLAALRGLPFETVYAEWPDIAGSGRSISSMLRWDANKRRLAAGFSTPIARDPAWRVTLGFDGRDENWFVPGTGSFKLRKAEGTLDLARATAGGWTWSSGIAISSRTVPVSRDGMLLQARAGISRDLLRLPSRNVVVTGSARLDVGRLTEGNAGVFAKPQGEIAAAWSHLSARLRGGRIAGDAPFDELFFLGVERDTSLWLRGHPFTKDGRKGNGPIGRAYGLANTEWNQPLWRPGFLTLSVGPFLDTARVLGRWYADPGIQARVELPAGPGLAVSWSRTTVYAVVSPLSW